MHDPRQLDRRAALLEDLHVAVIVTDPEDNWRILEWNSGAERVFGWTAPETVGEPVSEVIAAGPGRDQALADIRATGSWYGRSWMLRKTGDSVLIDSEAVQMTVCGRVACVYVGHEVRSPGDAGPAVMAANTSARGARFTAPTYGVVRAASIRSEDTDERLDEYLHGLLSANIRLARRLAGPYCSQGWLAKQLGVARRTVVRWENGGPPKMRTIARIAGVLGRTLDFFYTEHALVNDGDTA